MSIIKKGLLFIKTNLYFILTCIVLFVILLLLSKISMTIEGFDPIPKYIYNPVTTSIVSFNFSTSEYRPFNLVPYDIDLNVQQILDQNNNNFKIDTGNEKIYTTSSDGTTKYAFGTDGNSLKFIYRSEPMTFVDSIKRFFTNGITLPDFVKIIEYNNGVFNITINQPLQQQQQRTLVQTANSQRQGIIDAQNARYQSDLAAARTADRTAARTNPINVNTVTLDDIKDAFRRDNNTYAAGACYLTGLKYGLRPWRSWGSTPSELRTLWDSSSLSRNFCNYLVYLNDPRDVGSNSFKDYISAYKTPQISPVAQPLPPQTYVEANYNKQFSVALKDTSIIDFEKLFLNILPGQYNIINYNNETVTLKIILPDQNNTNTYKVEVTKSGNTDEIYLTFEQIKAPIFSILQNNNNINSIIRKSESGVEYPIIPTAADYISGFIVFNNKEYPVIVKKT